MSSNIHPELDKSPLLNDDGIHHYQKIMGVCQWLIVSRQCDLSYAVASLSRFQISPREGHLNLAKKVLGYLKKYKRIGIIINTKPPICDHLES